MRARVRLALCAANFAIKHTEAVRGGSAPQTRWPGVGIRELVAVPRCCCCGVQRAERETDLESVSGGLKVIYKVIAHLWPERREWQSAAGAGRSMNAATYEIYTTTCANNIHTTRARIRCVIKSDINRNPLPPPLRSSRIYCIWHSVFSYGTDRTHFTCLHSATIFQCECCLCRDSESDECIAFFEFILISSTISVRFSVIFRHSSFSHRELWPCVYHLQTDTHTHKHTLTRANDTRIHVSSLSRSSLGSMTPRPKDTTPSHHREGAGARTSRKGSVQQPAASHLHPSLLRSRAHMCALRVSIVKYVSQGIYTNICTFAYL